MSPDRLPKLPDVPLETAVELFVAAKQAERVSRRTLANYRWCLARFLTWAAEAADGSATSAADTPTTDLDLALVRRYLAAVDESGNRPATTHTYAKVLKTFLRFLYAEGLLEADLASRLTMPRLDEELLPIYSADEARRLLAACPNYRDTAIVYVLLDTGVRAAELCALDISDVDLADGTVTVRKGKGRKFRHVFLGKRARLALRRYLLQRRATDPAQPLFVSLRTGARMTPDGLLKLCVRLGTEANVPHCHPHRFRHTFATWALASGMNLDTLRRLMGHATFAVLTRYANQLPADLRLNHAEHSPVDTQL